MPCPQATRQNVIPRKKIVLPDSLTVAPLLNEIVTIHKNQAVHCPPPSLILVNLNQIHIHSPRLFGLHLNIFSFIHSYLCKLVPFLQVLPFPCIAHRPPVTLLQSGTSHPAPFHLRTNGGGKVQSL